MHDNNPHISNDNWHKGYRNPKRVHTSQKHNLNPVKPLSHSAALLWFPHSSSTIIVYPLNEWVLASLLPRVSHLHEFFLQISTESFIKYSYMLPLNIPHCIFVFSHSMFCLIVPLLACWFLFQGSLHITNIWVIGVNDSPSHNEHWPQTSS